LTVLGKCCLVLACSTSQAQWGSSYKGYTNGATFGAFVYALGKHLEASLDKEDSSYHAKTIYFALNNLETGEVAEWFNDNKGSHGKAQIKMTWTANGNVCRLVYSYVLTMKHNFTYEDKACYNNTTNAWNFVDKY